MTLERGTEQMVWKGSIERGVWLGKVSQEFHFRYVDMSSWYLSLAGRRGLGLRCKFGSLQHIGGNSKL